MSNQPDRPPCGIDEETIELYVMGRLRDPAALRHISACKLCASRVAEQAALIAALKKVLREHLDSEGSSVAKSGRPGRPARPEDPLEE